MLLRVEVFVCEIAFVHVVLNAQCTLARVATTTPLLSVSRRQPELHKLALQYAAKLVVACVMGCGWAFGAYALPSNLWYCMQHMPNVCLQDPKRAPKGVTMAHSRRYVRRVDDADVWHELSYLGSAFDADAYPIPGRKDLGMRYPYMSSRTQT